MTEDYPITPYQGSSGHSGSETSAERAAHRDGSGLTAETQQHLRTLIANAGYGGLTVAEIRSFSADHHGTISGALSNLHMKGYITRLKERRDRCQVYVLPEYVYGRETVAQGRGQRAGLTEDDYELIRRVRSAVQQGKPGSNLFVSHDGLARLLNIVERLS